MKKFILLLLGFITLFFFSEVLYPQIPNSSFENWTQGNPDDWTTNNNVPGAFTPVTQSSDPHSGSFAARIEIKGTFFPIPPILKAGVGGTGIPVSQRYNSLRYYYKNFPTTPNTQFIVLVGMFISNQLIGEGIFSTKDGKPFYTQLSVPISYFDSRTPDTASIYITLIDSTNSILSVASYAVIDDINFDPASGIEPEPGSINDFKLEQNYPNPFNPSTKISWQSPIGSWQTLKIYDVLGNEVATLADEYKPAGSYEVEFSTKDGSASGGNAYSLPSGVYLYQLRAVDPSTSSGQGFLATKKMILIK
jgi:hypothetical protein